MPRMFPHRGSRNEQRELSPELRKHLERYLRYGSRMDAIRMLEQRGIRQPNAVTAYERSIARARRGF